MLILYPEFIPLVKLKLYIKQAPISSTWSQETTFLLFCLYELDSKATYINGIKQ
jgi:hypothetical protein